MQLLCPAAAQLHTTTSFSLSSQDVSTSNVALPSEDLKKRPQVFFSVLLHGHANFVGFYCRGRGGGTGPGGSAAAPQREDDGTLLAERFERVTLDDEIDEKQGFARAQERRVVDQYASGERMKWCGSVI